MDESLRWWILEEKVTCRKGKNCCFFETFLNLVAPTGIFFRPLAAHQILLICITTKNSSSNEKMHWTINRLQVRCCFMGCPHQRRIGFRPELNKRNCHLKSVAIRLLNSGRIPICGLLAALAFCLSRQFEATFENLWNQHGETSCLNKEIFLTQEEPTVTSSRHSAKISVCLSC